MTNEKTKAALYAFIVDHFSDGEQASIDDETSIADVLDDINTAPEFVDAKDFIVEFIGISNIADSLAGWSAQATYYSNTLQKTIMVGDFDLSHDSMRELTEAIVDVNDRALALETSLTNALQFIFPANATKGV